MSAASPYTTAGRTGKSYNKFLQQNANFDPWSNLDQYAGAGAGNDPIIAQAFGWTNEWARNNGWGDGARIPLQQRQQIFMANLERARQQWTDNAANPGARQGVTWDTSLARNIPNEGWAYTSGGTPTGGSWELPQTPAPVPSVTTTDPGTASQPVTGSNGVTQYRWRDGSVHTTPEPAATPTTTTTTTSQSGGDTNGVNPGTADFNENLILSQNPDLALRRVMERLGFNMDRQGLFTDDIRQALDPYTKAYMEANAQTTGRSEKQSAAAIYDEMADMFKGGQGFSGMAALGQRQRESQTFKDMMASGSAKDARDMLWDNVFLRGAGLNRVGQAVRQTALERSLGPAGRYAQESLRNPNLMPADWLKQSQWADLLNNF